MVVTNLTHVECRFDISFLYLSSEQRHENLLLNLERIRHNYVNASVRTMTQIKTFRSELLIYKYELQDNAKPCNTTFLSHLKNFCSRSQHL